MPAKQKAPETTNKPKAQRKVTPQENPFKLNGKDWDRVKVVNHVCAQIATSTKSIATILKGVEGEITLPAYSAFMGFINESKDFQNQYARAKEDQADFMAEEMLEIADSNAEEVVDDKGGSRKDSADVQHKRLRVDTRKWLASKLKPKKYGDRQDVNVSGSLDIAATIIAARKRAGVKEDE